MKIQHFYFPLFRVFICFFFVIIVFSFFFFYLIFFNSIFFGSRFYFFFKNLFYFMILSCHKQYCLNWRFFCIINANSLKKYCACAIFTTRWIFFYPLSSELVHNFIKKIFFFKLAKSLQRYAQILWIITAHAISPPPSEFFINYPAHWSIIS